jgi:hypothetical protein
MRAAPQSPEIGEMSGREDNLTDEANEGKPTACSDRKAAVLDAKRRVSRTPPGSKNGARIYRGNSGTWESPLSPCERPEDEGYWPLWETRALARSEKIPTHQ